MQTWWKQDLASLAHWKRTLSHIYVCAWVKCVQDRRPLFPLLVLHTARLQDTFHSQQEQSQRDLFPVWQLPAAPHMKKCPCSLLFLKHLGSEYFLDSWQRFTRLLWGGSSCLCKPRVWRQTLPPRSWCRPLVPTLPSSDLLKPRGSLAISLTVNNRRTWSLFSSVPVIEKEARKSYVQKIHLGLHILPSHFWGKWCEMQGCSVPALLLMCSGRAVFLPLFQFLHFCNRCSNWYAAWQSPPRSIDEKDLGDCCYYFTNYSSHFLKQQVHHKVGKRWTVPGAISKCPTRQKIRDQILMLC